MQAINNLLHRMLADQLATPPVLCTCAVCVHFAPAGDAHVSGVCMREKLPAGLPHEALPRWPMIEAGETCDGWAEENQ